MISKILFFLLSIFNLFTQIFRKFCFGIFLSIQSLSTSTFWTSFYLELFYNFTIFHILPFDQNNPYNDDKIIRKIAENCSLCHQKNGNLCFFFVFFVFFVFLRFDFVCLVSWLFIFCMEFYDCNE